MKTFLDTSVLIAAFQDTHPHHEASFACFHAASKSRSACGVHTLAEVYAVMTALPVRPMILAEQAMLFVNEIRNRLSIVTLNAEEYTAAIEKLADLGFTGGRVYDALLLACAEKCEAETIYTWNGKHFRALAPSLASRIRTP